MNYFFGDRWDAPVTDHAIQAETPVGVECYYCNVAIVEGDKGFLRPTLPSGTVLAIHRGCDIAVTSGHYFGVCSCTGYEDYEAGRELERRADARMLDELRP